MANEIIINGRKTSNVSYFDRGLQYGDGVFETIASENGLLLCWDEHLQRLKRGCNILKISCPDETLLKKEALSLVNSSDLEVIKIIITRGQAGRGYALPKNSETNRMVSQHSWPTHPKENSTQGIKVRVCDYRYAKNSNLAGIKHLNRLEQILARSEWNDESIAEGIVLDNEDNVIEGTMSNLFCFIDDVLYTPDLTECGVEGIIRNKTIELAAYLNIDAQVKNISLQMLKSADEIFVCNSVIGVWPIKSVCDQVFSIGEKTQKLKQELINNHCIASSC